MIVGQKAAVLAALVEAHIDNFESHVLGTIVPHESCGVDVAKPQLQLELHVRAWSEMPADAGKTA